MATEVVMPKVDMVMETGTFVEWCKQEGEHVRQGETLFVIITDKAAIEVESPKDGVLAGLNAKVDDVIPVGQVIAYILAVGEALPLKAAPELIITLAAPAVEAVAETLSAAYSESPVAGKVPATPLARRMAQDLGMDLALITGRGLRGRIHKADVLAFQQLQPLAGQADCPAVAAPVLSIPVVRASSVTPPPVVAVPAVSTAATRNLQIPLPDARRKQVVAMSGARKIIAERLAYSAFTAPHINLSLHVDMTEAIRLRERLMEPLKALTGQRLSFTAILARAVATVLPHHPYLNASLSDGSIILWEDIHLGIATSVDDSLIVPVIRETQSRNLGQIMTSMADLTERARNRRLTSAEMTGSTFTISNLGMFGIESFTAIINPPEAAILAVGKMTDTPVRCGESFTFKPMIQLTVSADHRIVDGVAVARFLDELKSTLENPYLLI